MDAGASGLSQRVTGDRGFGGDADVARIGLEDTVHLPDGTRARSNAELVTAALAG